MRCEQCTRRAKFVCSSCGGDICYDHTRWRERNGQNYPICTYCAEYQSDRAPLSGYANHLAYSSQRLTGAQLAARWGDTATEAEKAAFVAATVAGWATEGTIVSPERARAELDALLVKYPHAL